MGDGCFNDRVLTQMLRSQQEVVCMVLDFGQWVFMATSRTQVATYKLPSY